MKNIKFRMYDQFAGVFDLNIIIPPGPIMQYTGILDCKDKEIYEGDILQAYDLKWKVIFTEGCFCAHRVGKIKLLKTMHCEVIGNIYDNPKLLYSKGE